MKVNLNQKDLIRLVKSLHPTDEMKKELPHVTEYGYSNLKGRWSWRIEELSKLSESELYELYKNLTRYGTGK